MQKQKSISITFWLRVALFNFCIVALAGVLLRYKINFSLPALNQKYLLHAHSHFAFVGWVSTALMALMVQFLKVHQPLKSFHKYNKVFIWNTISAFGMFIAFIYQGYDLFSISCSTLSILVSYLFIYYYWYDLKSIEDASFGKHWFKGALILLGISSLGAFSLAYLMANKIMIQDLYFSAIYFFLHFQYNGWFLFACFGIFFAYLYQKGFHDLAQVSKRLFNIMALTVAPTYCLSILWLKLPKILVYIANISGILQLVVLIFFLQILPIIRKKNSIKISKTAQVIWTMATIAFVLKIVLQMLSIIPYLSHFAFGFRPIVIGYLHLSFIGIISFFILGYMNEYLKTKHYAINGVGLWFFVIGFIVQEFILMTQGLDAMEIKPLPYANILLFYCAVLMALGLLVMFFKLKNKPQSQIN